MSEDLDLMTKRELAEALVTAESQLASLTQENEMKTRSIDELQDELVLLAQAKAEAEQRAAHWELAYNARLAGHALSPIDPPLAQQGEPKKGVAP
jgi:uncharacterized membrane-anchored protein